MLCGIMYIMNPLLLLCSLWTVSAWSESTERPTLLHLLKQMYTVAHQSHFGANLTHTNEVLRYALQRVALQHPTHKVCISPDDLVTEKQARAAIRGITVEQTAEMLTYIVDHINDLDKESVEAVSLANVQFDSSMRLSVAQKIIQDWRLSVTNKSKYC